MNLGKSFVNTQTSLGEDNGDKHERGEIPLSMLAANTPQVICRHPWRSGVAAALILGAFGLLGWWGLSESILHRNWLIAALVIDPPASLGAFLIVQTLRFQSEWNQAVEGGAQAQGL